MSIARHHAEWLSLLEISGPFLSMPVLLRAFPQGLDADDPAHAGELRAAYEEWADNQGGLSPNPAIHTAWIRYVLRETLGLPDELLAARQGIPESLKATLPEHGETLRPDLMLLVPAPLALAGRGAGGEGLPRLLIQVYPPAQSLDKTLPDRPWKANPATRMMELLRQTGVRLGLATNGEAWLLVSARSSEATSYITWYAGLWGEERLTQRAFRSLLGLRRFFGVPDDQTLEALLDASAMDQQEVTDQLGYQVRRAVEILVASLDRADQDAGRGLLSGISESVLYEASLTVMMRLVFLLSAEERGLLLLGDPLYDQHYAASTLRAQLHEMADQQGEEVLERRFDAWSRLLATFRAVHGGIQHENLRLPANGGSLFDPDRFPFLEGRPTGTRWRETPAHPLPINNRTVLHLLDALQMLQVKVPGGGPAEARRLSFRALDIEQIGHVYEGLLDHTALRAAEPILGLAGTRDKEPEIPLAKLEGLRGLEHEATKGSEGTKREGREEDFVAYLKEQTGRSESALRKALADEGPKTKDESGSRSAHYAARLRAACNNDDPLLRRVLPFASLIRDDDFGRPWVIPTGSVYVTAGTDRRSSGTHYTPRILTEPIVEHTLEPLVYSGPAEGWPKDTWQLRSPAELLELKICDMAMGSGAFLVQCDRYLAERLVEAWEVVEKRLRAENPALVSGLLLITPEGAVTDDPAQAIPADPDDRLILARRLVAERCLYGVDKNPLAVEMAKLSLWLVTLSKGRPFTFLDHALRCGDSLLGVDVKQLTAWSLTPDKIQTLEWFVFAIDDALKRALALRRKLETILEFDVHDAEAKQRLLAQAEETLQVIKLGADLLLASALAPAATAGERLRKDTLARFHLALTTVEALQGGRLKPQARAEARAAVAALRAEADALLAGQRPFHWPLEFPEVFLAEGRSGFDAFVGNPPFIGGKRIRESFGDDYREALLRLYSGSNGNGDYCTFFFLRAYEHLRHSGNLGLIATNTIAQGDTRRMGLDAILAQGGSVYNATNNQPWPGQAAVAVNILHIAKGPMQPPFLLDGKPTHTISSFLDSSLSLEQAHHLVENEGRSHIGSYVLGLGFTLDPEEAMVLIEKDPKNAEVLFPFLNGEDLNTSPSQTPSRWIINFFNWSLERAGVYSDCLAIVRERVYPARKISKGSYARLWWQYGRRQERLYEAVAPLRRALVLAITSKYLSFSFTGAQCVYSHGCGVVAFETTDYFAVLQSSLHEAWARKYSSTLETRLRYTPSDIFETFPLPALLFPGPLATDSIRQSLVDVGETYHEHRRQIMLARQEGLTTTYNRFHNPDERAADIARLRQLHVEMDRAVAAAYGWSDLDLGHGFHETAQGVRFTISEAARREVLGRLLELNHQRYAEEVAAGLHEKGKARRGKAVADDGGALKLF